MSDAKPEPHLNAVDYGLLRENLRLSVEERLRKQFALAELVAGLRRAVRGGRGGDPHEGNTMSENNYVTLLRLLSDAEVEYILVGALAAAAHGATRLTEDLDVVYRRTPENVDRLYAAVDELHPRIRFDVPEAADEWNREDLHRGLNFVLMTDLGALDLLGHIIGGGGYEDLLPHTIVLDAFGIQLKCLNLQRIIDVKRAAGRPKDLAALDELEALREEQQSQP